MDPSQTASLSPLTEEQKLTLKQYFHMLLKAFKNTAVFSDETEMARLSHDFIQLLPEHLQTETHAQVEALLQPKQRTLPLKALSQTSFLPVLRKAYLATLYPEFQTRIMAQALESSDKPFESTRSLETVLLQIAAGRNLEIENEGNHVSTALISAVAQNYQDIVSLLLEGGADINAKDKSGDTALMMAVFNAHEDIIQLLLEKGADVNTKNNRGDTALIEAAQQGHEKIIKRLIQKGADINTKNKDGNTVLIITARNEKMNIVSFLLNHQTRTGLPQANLDQAGELMSFFENNVEFRHLIRAKGGREQQSNGDVLSQANAHEQNVHAWYDVACAHHNFSVLKSFYSDKSPKALEAAYEAFVTAMKNMTKAFQSDSSLLKRCFSDKHVKLGATVLAQKGKEALERLTTFEMPSEWFRYTAPTGEQVQSVLKDLPLKTALAYLWLAIQDKDFLKAQFPVLSDETLKSTTQNAIEGLAQALVLAQMEYGENIQACAKGLTSKVFHLLEGFASGASVETDVTADLNHLTTRTDWILQEQKRLALQGELDPASMTALMPDMSTFILNHTAQHHPHLLPMLAELLVNKTLYTEIMDPNTSGKSLQIEWEEKGESVTETAHDWQIRQYILGLGKQYFETQYAKHFAGALQAIPTPRPKDFLLFEQSFALQAPLAEVDLPNTAANLQEKADEKTAQLNHMKTGSPAFYQTQVEIAYLKALHARQTQTEQNQANIKLAMLKRAEISLQTEIQNLENELTKLAADSSKSTVAQKKLSDLRNQHSELIRRIQVAEALSATELGIAEAGSASSTFFSSLGTGQRKPLPPEVTPENGAASPRLSNPR